MTEPPDGATSVDDAGGGVTDGPAEPRVTGVLWTRAGPSAQTWAQAKP